MQWIGVAQKGRDVAAMVSLLQEQPSHLVAARRTVAASMREQWGGWERERESDAERDGERERELERKGEQRREPVGVIERERGK